MPRDRAAPRLLLDAMLGSLARWLRLLGYDAVYARAVDDDDLIERARGEQRILVTRDRMLARRRSAAGLAVLIRARSLRGQWVELARACALRPAAAAALTRCGDCNTVLVPLSRARARPRVPPYVHATRRRFRRCPGCGRVFWRATHRRGISGRLDELRSASRAAGAGGKIERPLRRERAGQGRRARRSP